MAQKHKTSTRRQPRRELREQSAPRLFTRFRATDKVYQADMRRRGSAVEDLIEVADRIGRAPFDRPQEMPAVVISELAHAVKTVRALCVLASCGYGPQGIVLARVVFESMLPARWALAHCDIADEYMDLHYRLAATLDNEAWQRSTIARFDNQLAEPLTTEERSRAVKLFNKRSTNLWTGHRRISELVDEVVELLPQEQGVVVRRVFQLMVTDADRLAHASGIATIRGLEATDDSTGLATYSSGPSQVDIERALQMGGTCLSMMLQVIVPVIAPHLAGALTQAQARGWRAWRDVHELQTIADTDPCICDEPTGTWSECHGYTSPLADRDAEAQSVLARRGAHAGRSR